MEEENEYMQFRKFHLTIKSAENLPNLRSNDSKKTQAYATIFIGSAEKGVRDRTETDKKNGLNPAWCYANNYQISESGVQYRGLTLVIKLYCNIFCGPDRLIGEVSASMKDLYDSALPHGGHAAVDRPILRGTEKTTGTLKFSYSFGDTFAVKKRELSGISRLGAWIKQVAIYVAVQAIFVLLVLYFRTLSYLCC